MTTKTLSEVFAPGEIDGEPEMGEVAATRAQEVVDTDLVGVLQSEINCGYHLPRSRSPELCRNTHEERDEEGEVYRVGDPCYMCRLAEVGDLKRRLKVVESTEFHVGDEGSSVYVADSDPLTPEEIVERFAAYEHEVYRLRETSERASSSASFVHSQIISSASAAVDVLSGIDSLKEELTKVVDTAKRVALASSRPESWRCRWMHGDGEWFRMRATNGEDAMREAQAIYDMRRRVFEAEDRLEELEAINFAPEVLPDFDVSVPDPDRWLVADGDGDAYFVSQNADALREQWVAATRRWVRAHYDSGDDPIIDFARMRTIPASGR